MNDDVMLLDKARESLQAGSLPARRPDRTWGGPGVGVPCAVCGAPVSSDELELELEFTARDGSSTGKYHVHVRCYGAWEAVRRSCNAGAESVPAVTERRAVPRQAPASATSAASAGLVALPDHDEHGKIAGDGARSTYDRGAA